MSCSKTIGPVRADVTAALAASTQYIAVTPWLPSMQFTKAKAMIALLNVSGNLEVAPAVQFAATDTLSPASWQEIEATGTFISSGGTQDCTPVVDLSTPGDERFFVRFGIAAKNTSGTDFSRGSVNLTIQGTAA